jgi:hypothetical protein
VLVGNRDRREMRWLLPGGGEPFCDVDGGPDMVVVPADTFMIGSPDDEPERFKNEGPRHEVTLAYPFAVGRDSVTQAATCAASISPAPASTVATSPVRASMAPDSTRPRSPIPTCRPPATGRPT